MPAISVVLPTIKGREESLEKIFAAYERTMQEVEHEIIVVQDAPTWPSACNYGYEQAKYDIIHFTADDLEPLDGWWEPAVGHLDGTDELPNAAVYDHLPPPEGKFSNWADGKDGDLCHFTRVPILRRDQYERIGPWPEIVYFADIWLSEKARTLAMRTRILYGYAFVHHWSQINRVDTKVNLDEAGFALNRLREKMV